MVIKDVVLNDPEDSDGEYVYLIYISALLVDVLLRSKTMFYMCWIFFPFIPAIKFSGSVLFLCKVLLKKKSEWLYVLFFFCGREGGLRNLWFLYDQFDIHACQLKWNLRNVNQIIFSLNFVAWSIFMQSQTTFRYNIDKLQHCTSASSYSNTQLQCTSQFCIVIRSY